MYAPGARSMDGMPFIGPREDPCYQAARLLLAGDTPHAAEAVRDTWAAEASRIHEASTDYDTDCDDDGRYPIRRCSCEHAAREALGLIVGHVESAVWDRLYERVGDSFAVATAAVLSARLADVLRPSCEDVSDDVFETEVDSRSYESSALRYHGVVANDF